MNILFKKYLIFSLLFIPFLMSIPNQADAVVKFRRPITTTSMSAWYDQNSIAGASKNYACTAGTPYDGHKGTDFNAVTGTSVYAGALGGLYYSYDSCYTTKSPGCGGGFGNHARIDHEGTPNGASGMVSIYAHLKKGTVSGPASVFCGASIGQSGASGDVTGPHLHFELRPNGFASSAPKDPFAGSCSQTTSYWTSVNSNRVPGTTCQ